MRFELTDSLFNSLSKLCDKLKIDWFYPDYIKRKTIDEDDLKNIYDNWVIYEPEISVTFEIKSIFETLLASDEKI